MAVVQHLRSGENIGVLVEAIDLAFKERNTVTEGLPEGIIGVSFSGGVMGAVPVLSVLSQGYVAVSIIWPCQC